MSMYITELLAVIHIEVIECKAVIEAIVHHSFKSLRYHE